MSNTISNQSMSTLPQSPSLPVKNIVAESSYSAKPEMPTKAAAINRQNIATEDPKIAIDQVVEQLNNFMQEVQRNLNFSVDKESGRTVIKVLNTETREVIRQIPAEDVLNRIHNLQDIQGLLFRGEA